MPHFLRFIAVVLPLVLVLGCQRREPEQSGATIERLMEKPAPVVSVPGKYGDFQQIFADVAEKALPSVVSIHSEKHIAAPQENPSGENFEGSPFEYFFGAPTPPQQRRESGLGSGVIIDANGTILTNNHVIQDADKIRVQMSDDREFMAEVVGADKASDLAVIRLKDAKGSFTPMALGNSDALRIGEWVIAVGSPYGLSQTVTTGIISAKGRHNTGINNYENFLQTDAAINPGNSGGALLNLRGELVGINTAIFSRSGGYQGIGFAIPIDMARKISADLIRDGEVTRGWLGVSIQPLDAELAETMGIGDRKGALVGGVVPGGPSDKAGLRRGDVILRVGGNPVRDPNDLLNVVALQPPGSWVEVAVNREGKEIDFKVKVAKRDEGHMARYEKLEEEGLVEAAAFGLRLEDLSQKLRRAYGVDPAVARGAVVTGVEPNSRAARARLEEGDVILEANRTKVSGASDFKQILGSGRKGNRILLLVHRRGGTFFTAL